MTATKPAANRDTILRFTSLPPLGERSLMAIMMDRRGTPAIVRIVDLCLCKFVQARAKVCLHPTPTAKRERRHPMLRISAYCHEIMAHGEDQRLESRGGPELGEDVRDMGVDGSDSDMEPLGDLSIAQALGESLKDLQFPWG